MGADMSQPPFHIMTKPVSHQCNLKCDYCFYLEKDAFYPEQSKMSMGMLEEYVRTYIQSSPQQHVDFAWQGGEPTLAGLDFYKAAVEFQRKHGAGKRITNSFQTNGIAINNQWAEFFAQHQFLIGLSVDGDASIHDKYRISTNGKPTFERVKHVIGLLLAHKVKFNTLTVVNDTNWNKGKQVYQTLKYLGSTHMQFIPVVELNASQKERFDPSLAQEVTPFSVPKAGYGIFMTEIFDEWVNQDLGRIHIQAFEILLAQQLGYPAGLCIFNENCGNNLVLEANGDLYSCDHFVYPENKLGNIKSQPMLELAQSEQQQAFGQSKSATLTTLCHSCEYLSQCHGGCPKQRIVPVEGENYRQNHLCESYRKLFSHTHKPMASMAKQITSRRP